MTRPIPLVCHARIERSELAEIRNTPEPDRRYPDQNIDTKSTASLRASEGDRLFVTLQYLRGARKNLLLSNRELPEGGIRGSKVEFNFDLI